MRIKILTWHLLPPRQARARIAKVVSNLNSLVTRDLHKEQQQIVSRHFMAS